MPDQQLILGIIAADSTLATEEGKLLLTSAMPQEGRAPAAAPLAVAAGAGGQRALVRGRLQGGVVYGAEIVEIVSPVTGALLARLVKNNSLSLAELENELAVLRDAAAEPKSDPPPFPPKLCALVIGHKKASPGAVNAAAGISEFEFNDDLTQRIERQVRRLAVQRVYRRIYNELPADINALGPDVVVSLHCNAFNRQVSGTETLYYEKSGKGRQVAAIIQQQLVDHLGLPDRGIKGRSSEDRGGYLLRYTHAPCVIAEPFFIDNDADLATAQRDLAGLAAAYARAIDALPELGVF